MIAGQINRLILTVFVLLLFPLGASAQKDKNKNSRHEPTSGTEVRVAVDIFAGKDRDVIRQYFMDSRDNLPPGLAKRGGDLPPGLERQLQRKGQLPPGLDKRIAAFPADLERQLPPLKPGLVRGVLEGRAVIYSPKTAAIFDVFLVF